ncbi:MULTISPECIES: hypothetical protein [Lysobacter]|uniref:Uncharacterized protein n=1 Tax=Lysobacter firmicutimachus TaxID=1792846 RepID=A0ABU8D747_9GAMM|nr:hypothetical protein [Lysobacter antibioticus]
MNAPLILVLGMAAIALAVCLLARNVTALAAGLVTIWLCICYMLLIPFTGAMRIAIASVDPHSSAFMAVGTALTILLNEVTPARWAIAFLSLALVLVAWVRSRRCSA